MDVIKILRISKLGTKAKVKICGTIFEVRINKDQSLKMLDGIQSDYLEDESELFLSLEDELGQEGVRLILNELNKRLLTHDEY